MVLARYTADAWRGRVYAVRYFPLFISAGAAVEMIALLHEPAALPSCSGSTPSIALVMFLATLGLVATISNVEGRTAAQQPAELITPWTISKFCLISWRSRYHSSRSRCPRRAATARRPTSNRFHSVPSVTVSLYRGSNGAKIFNETLPGIAVRLLERVPGLTIVHQTGERALDATREAYMHAGVDPARVTVTAFLNHMPTVCRC